MGPLQLAIYDSWWQAIELTKKKKTTTNLAIIWWPHIVLCIYIYIWLWVKTLAPSDPEDSWDLWMFIPRLAMLERSRWAMFPGEPPPCFVLPPSVYSMVSHITIMGKIFASPQKICDVLLLFYLSSIYIGYVMVCHDLLFIF